jgi:hypothetical protein
MKPFLSLSALMTLVMVMTGTAPTETMAKSVSDTVIAITPGNPSGFSKKQTIILTAAHQIAQKDGHPNPKLLQGIALKESKAGDFLPSPRQQMYAPQYGIMQVKTVAARAVLDAENLWSSFGFRTRSNDEIKIRLINDDNFNMTVASKYLKYLRAQYNIKSETSLLCAYNQGPSGAKLRSGKANSYAVSVLRLAGLVKM